MTDWIDITRPINDRLLCWPGRKPPTRIWEQSLAKGDHCGASSWVLSAHTGTHLDAPSHFVGDGATVDQIPPGVLIGECAVIEGDQSGAQVLDLETVKSQWGYSRILVRTGHSGSVEPGSYPPHAELMTAEAAAFLLDGGMKLLGTDRLSVDSSEGKTFDLHRQLLGAGCVILEGLDLGKVAPGTYQLCVLPLRLEGAEASPARALLR